MGPNVVCSLLGQMLFVLYWVVWLLTAGFFFFFFFFFHVFYYVLLLCLVRILHLYSPHCGRFSELTFYGPLNSLLCFQHLSKSRFYLVLYTEEENFQFFCQFSAKSFFLLMYKYVYSTACFCCCCFFFKSKIFTFFFQR